MMQRIETSSQHRIIVFRALKLGDMLCAVPALRALRSGFPRAEIVLAGLPWAIEFVERFSQYLDGFRPFPGYPGLPEQAIDIDRLPRFFESIVAERFDLAIQLHGSGSISNEVIARFGVRTQAGFYEPSRACPDPATFLPYPDQGLEVSRLLRLVEHLGIRSRGEELEFPLTESERGRARWLIDDAGFDSSEYVCIHGGASVAERRWPVERFAAVADVLADRGYGVVLTGSAGEAGLTRAIADSMRSPALDLAGMTPLGTLAAVLERARLLVCNDTGVSHLADALRVPSVVISTGDNPRRWAPADRLLHRVLCSDSGVTVTDVIAQIDELPRRTHVAHSVDRQLMVFGATSRGNIHERSPGKPCDRCAS
jgi:ADP-heptose:LPS heptosyltransferase